MMKARCLKHYWSQRANAATPDYEMNEFRAEKALLQENGHFFAPTSVPKQNKNPSPS